MVLPPQWTETSYCSRDSHRAMECGRVPNAIWKNPNSMNPGWQSLNLLVLFRSAGAFLYINEHISSKDRGGSLSSDIQPIAILHLWWRWYTYLYNLIPHFYAYHRVGISVVVLLLFLVFPCNVTTLSRCAALAVNGSPNIVSCETEWVPP
jgi:hypothetical protein